MLEKIDLKTVFEAARRAGSQRTHLYAEQREERTVEFTGRQQKSRMEVEEGAVLRLDFGSLRSVLSTEHLSTAHLLALIENSVPPDTNSAEKTERQNSFIITDKRNFLEQMIKKSAIDLDTYPPPKVHYTEKNQRFLVGTSPESCTLAQTASATFDAHFRVSGHPVSVHRSSHSPESLWKSIENSSLLEPKLPKGWENPWPAPQGKLPIHWSSECLAKLLIPFLKVFEVERIEQGQSLVSRWNVPLPLKFDLYDRPNLSLGSVDQRGVLKREITLLKGGLPQMPFLGQEPSGHARRFHYLDSSVEGYWKIQLVSEFQKDRLLEDLQMGVAVEDIRVEKFDPVTGQAVITLLNISLLHHGDKGECTHPVTLHVSLLELFSSFEVFSKNSQSYGHWISKNGSPLLTEFVVPDALSSQFFLPGTVSPSHYW